MWQDPDATFPDPSILQALQMAYEGTQDIILCTRTGGGKSLVPILLSEIEEDGTIVVLPLRSLMHDWKRKLTATAVHFTYYDPTSPTTPLDTRFKLILVSCDQFVTALFDEAVAKYQLKRQIYRVFVDEAHLPFMSCDFRRSLRRMSNVRFGPNVQIIPASGSLPPAFLPYIARFYGLTDSPAVVRSASSSRPELEYSIERVAEWDQILPRILEYINENPDLMPYDQDSWNSVHKGPPPPEMEDIFSLIRHLFYVPSKGLGHELAQALACQFYNSSALAADGTAMSQGDMDAIIEEWQSADTTSRSLVTTNRYSEGNDNPYVVSVIHANTPTGMIGYHQETNRAARRPGLHGICHMIACTQFSFIPDGALDFKGERAINDLVFRDVEVCIRYAITFWIDGAGVLCNPASDRPCSRCRHAYSLGLSEQETLSMLTAITIRRLNGEQVHANPAEFSASSPLVFTSWDGQPTPTLPDAYHSSLRRYNVEHASDVRRWKAIDRAMKAFVNKCPVCTIHNLPRIQSTVAKHVQFFKCPMLSKNCSKGTYLEWRKTIKYSWDGRHVNICVKCHLCKGDKTLHKEDFSKCPSTVQDVIAPALWALYWRPNDMRKHAEQFFDTTWQTTTEYMEWLLSDPGDDWESNLLKLFVWMYESYIRQPT